MPAGTLRERVTVMTNKCITSVSERCAEMKKYQPPLAYVARDTSLKNSSRLCSVQSLVELSVAFEACPVHSLLELGTNARAAN